jgi:hypothetical protein
VLRGQIEHLRQFEGKKFNELEIEEQEWEQFTRNAIIHGFGDPSQNLSNFYDAKNAGVWNMMGVSDHQRQLNFEERIKQYGATLRSSIKELEINIGPGHDGLAKRSEAKPSNGPAILISHSSKDGELADALCDFLRAGLLISANSIRCSSVEGSRLPAGAHTESRLRAEVNSSSVVIGLMTPNSLVSAYVMFELGARWGAGSLLIPLLAGITTQDLRGPIGEFNALRADNDAQLHQLLEDIGKSLGKTVEAPASYTRLLGSVKRESLKLAGLGQGVPQQTAKPVEPKLKVSLRVAGEPPSPQILSLKANRSVKLIQVDYLLSNEVCIGSDSKQNSLESSAFEIPIDGTMSQKLWNTPRSDRHHWDHSGPAKLRVIVLDHDEESSHTLPIQMQSVLIQNNAYLKFTG